MKKKPLLVALMLQISLLAFAQIPNPGFENWSHNSFPAYDNPDGWGTVNDQTAIIGVNTVQKESSVVHSGSYAVKLETFFISFANETAPGITGTGTFNTNTRNIDGGFAYTQRPTHLSGWYQYSPATGDNCDMSIELWRWNAGVRETIATGTFTNSSAVGSYTRFAMQLSYQSANSPDSAQIILSSSNTSNPVQGSVMYVDDLEFLTLNPLAADKDSTNAYCAGACDGSASVTPSGGMAPYTYAWGASAGSATDSSVTGLCPGSYSVTVTDAFGSSVSATFNITTVNVLTAPSMSSTNENCGQSDGTATATPTDGTGPYTFAWDANAGNQTDSTATNLGSGNYHVTVSDANGCTVSGTATVSNSGGLTASISAREPYCHGDDSGYAVVVASGGTPGYTYLWDANTGSQTGDTATGLYAGSYSVTVSDNVGCSYVQNVTIGEPDSLSAVLDIDSVGCNGDTYLVCRAVGGTGTLQVSWNTNSLGFFEVAFESGNYCVTVTDSNGCSYVVCDSIFVPDSLSLSLTASDATTNGGNDGSVNATASGGSGALTYTWSNSGTGASITGLSAGTYTVTVTDNNGCSKVDSATVSEPVGIDEQPETKINIYPNPTGDIAILQIADPNELLSISMYSASGKLVHEYTSADWTQQTSLVLDLSEATPGVYYVKFISHQNSQTLKLLKLE